jgi:hypothetical protein
MNGWNPANGWDPYNGWNPNGWNPNGWDPNGWSPNGWDPNGSNPNGAFPYHPDYRRILYCPWPLCGGQAAASAVPLDWGVVTEY